MILPYVTFLIKPSRILKKKRLNYFLNSRNIKVRSQDKFEESLRKNWVFDLKCTAYKTPSGDNSNTKLSDTLCSFIKKPPLDIRINLISSSNCNENLKHKGEVRSRIATNLKYYTRSRTIDTFSDEINKLYVGKQPFDKKMHRHHPKRPFNNRTKTYEELVNANKKKLIESKSNNNTFIKEAKELLPETVKPIILPKIKMKLDNSPTKKINKEKSKIVIDDYLKPVTHGGIIIKTRNGAKVEM